MGINKTSVPHTPLCSYLDFILLQSGENPFCGVQLLLIYSLLHSGLNQIINESKVTTLLLDPQFAMDGHVDLGFDIKETLEFLFAVLEGKGAELVLV